MSEMMADYHHSRHRHVSTSSEDYEDESLDPRIQVELEKLNKASEEINRLELELDDARASFRQTLSESTQKLDALAKKLGSCVEKARPYYDARVKAKDAHLETQRAALRFERACSMHEAAKEMVQLAEQGYMRREQPSDPAWQEMLNHATMKVNEAEKERNESEAEHQRTMIKFKIAEDQVQMLQKDLKRAINKSKPYFEMKARFNQLMEEHKHKVSILEEDVSSAKSLYSTALRSLEAISDEIHRQRLERRQQEQLGVRGAGVGAECPLPPPSWGKGANRDSQHALDPLGVIKVPATQAATGHPHRRSRNLSGESSHGRDIPEEEEFVKGSESQVSCQEEVEGSTATLVQGSGSSTTSTQNVDETKVKNDAIDSAGRSNTEHMEPLSPKLLVPSDPLGVLPPTYVSAKGGINHPAFGGAGAGSHHTRLSAPISHPSHSQPNVTWSAQARTSSVQRSASMGHPQQQFRPESILRPNPEEARRQSYRKAVEASERDLEVIEDVDNPELDEVYEDLPPSRGKELVFESRQRSYSNPPNMQGPRSPSKTIPGKPVFPAVQDALADGRRHGSAPERSAPLTSYSGSESGSPSGGSPSLKKKQKLQGLILRIDPTMDMMHSFEPRPRSQTGPPAPAPSSQSTPPPPPPSSSSTTPVSTSTPPQMTSTAGENVAPVLSPPSQTSKAVSQTPTSSAPLSSHRLGAAKSDISLTQPSPSTPPSKPIIRSASTVSSTLSERSETEFSEIESISATQSPTKPSRSKLLHVPPGIEANSAEENSDTESLASTGPMLDDEQVEFLTMDFSSLALDGQKDDVGLYASSSLPVNFRRNQWSRMSLPPNLTHLEQFLKQAKRLSGEFKPRGNSQDNDYEESPTEFDKTLQFENDDEEGEEDELEEAETLERTVRGGEVTAVPSSSKEHGETEAEKVCSSEKPAVEEDSVEKPAVEENSNQGCSMEEKDDESGFVESETIDVRL